MVVLLGVMRKECSREKGQKQTDVFAEKNINIIFETCVKKMHFSTNVVDNVVKHLGGKLVKQQLQTVLFRRTLNRSASDGNN